MTTLPRKRIEASPYRLAVPMSEATQSILDRFCDEWGCTRTEAARWLLETAAAQYMAGTLKVGEY